MTETKFEKAPSKVSINPEKKEKGLYESLIFKLERYQKKATKSLSKKHKKAFDWLTQQQYDLSQIKTQAAKAVTTGTIVAALFTTTAAPIMALSTPNITYESLEDQLLTKERMQQKVNELLKKKGPYKLTAQDERAIAHLISTRTGVNVTPELENHRLRHVAGEIATERHMPIYPGQSLSDHLQDPGQIEAFGWTGMTAHPSAWGYFANSRQEASYQLIENEKYYFAVQTFLIPNWSSSWPKEKEWYKFRKMLVYNPETGQAAIGVIADSGPASFTGRQFGGSPEIMDHIGLGKNKKIGDVVVLFVDESQSQVALGPVQVPSAQLALEGRR